MMTTIMEEERSSDADATSTNNEKVCSNGRDISEREYAAILTDLANLNDRISSIEDDTTDANNDAAIVRNMNKILLSQAILNARVGMLILKRWLNVRKRPFEDDGTFENSPRLRRERYVTDVYSERIGSGEERYFDELWLTVHDDLWTDVQDIVLSATDDYFDSAKEFIKAVAERVNNSVRTLRLAAVTFCPNKTFVLSYDVDKYRATGQFSIRRYDLDTAIE